MEYTTLPGFGALPVFDSLTPASVEETTAQIIAQGRQNMQAISSLDNKNRTFENTVLAFDRILGDSELVRGLLDLMAYVHPDGSVREACWKSISDISAFCHDLALDEPLFHAVKAFCDSEAYGRLQGARKKYADDLMRDYRRNGFLLPAERRDTLKQMLNRITGLCIDFSSNINEYSDTLTVGEDEMDGLPADYKAARRTADGRYNLTLDAPSYTPYMKYATSGKTRKELYFKYNTRAPKNGKVLLDLLRERQALAGLLQYPTYAAYAAEVSMARTPEAILRFEHDLLDKVRVKARRDLQELLAVKGSGADTIYPWETAYYTERLLKEKYGVDNEAVKQYFEADKVIEGIFGIAQQLYGVRFEEDRTVRTWHPSVKTFYMMKDGRKAGLIWLDLFPRDGKYNHAACFTLANGHQTDDGYRLPVAALVCNFPAPAPGHPSLMPHADVVTLFHECGHLLHSLLAGGEISDQSGINNEQDFVEVPSQLFENWAWDYGVLSGFARHWQTGEVLSKDLFDRMLAARNVCSGVQTLQQLFYGLLDMTYHNGDVPADTQALTDTVEKLQNSITFYPYLAGTHFQTSFGHLTNYAAGYYGYLWSLVYAQDIFSVFAREGVMSPLTGARFRDEVLAKGSSEDAMTLLRRFLQREPSQEAFLASIGLQPETDSAAE
ncbi:MAG: Zn-dependent oligopeptidase [Bacteroidales bacterium]|nr:Zn-dependent oligopeptidase [Bacteroidales bacterium]